MILISGYDTALYERMLTCENGWSRLIINTHTKGSAGVELPRSEVLWMNSHFVKARNANAVPITLTPKELRDKKVNPER